jgi:hypothetical protein
MSASIGRRTLLGGLAASGSFATSLAQAQGQADLVTTARDAFFFVAPLIEVAGVRARTIGQGGGAGPGRLNTFHHARNMADPDDHSVTSPNNDTIYSNGFVDLTRGPVTLVVPDTGDRYLSVGVMDMYTNYNVVLSSAAPGGAAGTYRLVGPGQPTSGPHDLRIATPHAWVIARTLVDGEADLPAVHRVQDKLLLSGPPAPPLPVYAKRNADWSAYFASAAQLLASDPPTSKAGYNAFLAVRKACRSGDFARSGYSDSDAAAIDQGVQIARRMPLVSRSKAVFTNGWTYPKPTLGQFGDDFTYRAMVALSGVGGLPTSEAMYMRAQGDAGSMFHGDGPFRLTLREKIPAEAFWSITMYELTPDGQSFLTQNPINRYAIGDRTQGLKRSADGAIDIWISRTDPGGERSSNWLPAPRQGPFTCTFRVYRPGAALREGRFRLPPVVKV